MERFTHLDDAGFIHATTGERVAEVVARRYGDLDLPLLDIVIDVDALEAQVCLSTGSTAHPASWVSCRCRQR